MKLKKKVKRRILIIIVLILIAVLGFVLYKNYSNPEKEIKETKIVNEIKKYGYKLKENKPSKYKEMFSELKKILEAEEVNEEDYAKKIAEMFIYDFYSLKDKTAKTDIGGVDFISPEVLENFLENAQDTYYKYVENNIYNDRKQSLPVVTNLEVVNMEKKEFKYKDSTDENAYYITMKWDYTDEAFSDYQKEATLVFIHENEKLYLVELQK